MPRLLRIPKSGRSVIGGCRKTGSRTIEEQKAFLLWLRKKVRHPWLGGPRRLTMYFATLDCATSNPELEQFAVDAWRAPKRIFDAHPPDQYAQLRVDLRSPSLWARLPTPVAAKAGPVPTHERLGPDDCENLQD